jgi:hypothetical protein
MSIPNSRRGAIEEHDRFCGEIWLASGGGRCMGRIGRIVIPGFPHHVTQCGNRRQPIFFESGDLSRSARTALPHRLG